MKLFDKEITFKKIIKAPINIFNTYIYRIIIEFLTRINFKIKLKSEKIIRK
jgi:hypothetical protein